MSRESLLIELLAAGVHARPDVVLGIGDDAAAVMVPPGRALVLAIDTLVKGVHFLPDIEPSDLGYRSLAVNLSDLAALGATPAWATLSLTLPDGDPDWVAEFSIGFSTLARDYGIALVGGDTVRGPLVVTVQVAGHADPANLLRRDGAQVGDLVCVSGELGAAAAGLALLRTGRREEVGAGPLVTRFLRPTPRVALGCALAGVASAALDISDGLSIDAHRLAAASGVGIEIEAARVPVAPAANKLCGAGPAERQAWQGGDDYELLFTIPQANLEQARRLPAAGQCPISCIGRVVSGQGVWRRIGAERLPVRGAGFNHFPSD